MVPTPKSEFQNQHPLSPKKLKKKMIGPIVGGFFANIFFAAIPATISLILLVSNNPNVSGPDGAMRFFSREGIWFLIFYAIYLIAYRAYWKSYIDLYFYDAKDGFLTIKKGVFMPTEIHVQFQKIQDVYVDQDFWDRIMGLYDVHIASATVSSGIEAHIDGVDQATAENLKTFLLGSIRGSTQMPGAPTAPAAAAAPASQAAPAKISVPENISSETYPITSTWMTSRVLGLLFSSIVFSVILLLVLFKPGDNGSDGLGTVLGLSPAVAWLIVFVVWFVGGIVKVRLWKKNYEFKLEPDYIYMRQGIISMEEQHVPYDRIQDVIVRQSFWEKMFGLSSVFIQNAVAAPVMVRGRRGAMQPNGILIPGQTPATAQQLSEIIRSILVNTRNQQTGL